MLMYNHLMSIKVHTDTNNKLQDVSLSEEKIFKPINLEKVHPAIASVTSAYNNNLEEGFSPNPVARRISSERCFNKYEISPAVKSISAPTLPTKKRSNSKVNIKYIVKMKLPEYSNLGTNRISSKQNVPLPFAKKVNINDEIQVTLEDANNGIYKVIDIGSDLSPWILEKI